MRPKGRIGELKLSGFLISLALCLGFAFIAYSRFTFVMEPSTETKKADTELQQRLKDLEAQIADLKAQLTSLKEQKQPLPGRKLTK